MKYIMLLRHAKSSWDNPQLDDFERPLAGRGLTDAPAMGSFLKKTGYKPDIIISSPAQRALETTLAVSEVNNLEKDSIRWDRDLYLSGADAYLSAIAGIPDKAEKAVLVGHNPNIEELASLLCSGTRNSGFRVPTAGLICFESYSLQWKDVKPGTCHLKWMMIPKVLKQLND